MLFSKFAKDLFSSLNLGMPVQISKRGDSYIGFSKGWQLKPDMENNFLYSRVIDRARELVEMDGEYYDVLLNRYFSQLKYGRYKFYDIYTDDHPITIISGDDENDKNLKIIKNIISQGFAEGPDGEEYVITCDLIITGKMSANRKIVMRYELALDINRSY